MQLASAEGVDVKRYWGAVANRSSGSSPHSTRFTHPTSGATFVPSLDPASPQRLSRTPARAVGAAQVA
jgi:hypothetical protein